MGDRISTVQVKVFISAAGKAAATEAVKSACRGFWKSSDGTDPVMATTSFAEAMAAMQWFVTEDPTKGDVVGVYFEKKPYGDDEVAAAIAPFAREGSVVEVADDECHHWRWKFTAGRAVRQDGRVIYDE